MPLSRCGSESDEPLQGIGVLVVEDNIQVADALACVLTDAGMAVMGPTSCLRPCVK
jgi:hypothetical protein